MVGNLNLRNWVGLLFVAVFVICGLYVYRGEGAEEKIKRLLLVVIAWTLVYFLFRYFSILSA